MSGTLKPRSQSARTESSHAVRTSSAGRSQFFRAQVLIAARIVGGKSARAEKFIERERAEQNRVADGYTAGEREFGFLLHGATADSARKKPCGEVLVSVTLFAGASATVATTGHGNDWLKFVAK